MKLFFMLLFLSIVFFSSTLYSNSTQHQNTNHAVVFMYHHFGKSQYPSTNITLKQFQAHLDYLDDNNYNVWPLSKIILAVKNKTLIPAKTVALTIDDAYISIYTKAYPMLKRKRFPFTVFVNTTPISDKPISYMSWDMMREMQQHGAEFANHSSTHDYLIPRKNERKREWKKRIKNELVTAQKALQRELGENTNTHPKIISYPFGEYTQESAEYIASLGYIGIAQTSGVINFNSDLRRIPRFAMNENFGDMKGFKLKLQTLPLDVISAKPWGTTVKNNPPKLRLKLKNEMTNIGCYTANGKAIGIKYLTPKELEIQAPYPLQGVRDRYTCTAQDAQKKWHWYSHLWILNK